MKAGREEWREEREGERVGARVLAGWWEKAGEKGEQYGARVRELKVQGIEAGK